MIAIETKEATKEKKLILKSYPKNIQEKLKYFFFDILDNPRSLDSVGSPEELKHKLFPTFSRELTKKDRIVYEIRAGKDFEMPEESEVIVFYQYLGHYKDK